MKNITEIYEEILSRISKIELDAVKNDGYPNGYTAIRVWPNGSVTTSRDVTKCLPESEYFGMDPHPLTIWQRTGAGAFCLPIGEAGVEVEEISSEELERINGLCKKEYGYFLEEADSQFAKDFMYAHGGWRKGSAGWQRYTDMCMWMEQPDMDPCGEIKNHLAEWAKDNLKI